MKCSNCGYEGESRFCPECGTPMEELELSKKKVCPKCGEPTDAKFCPSCGYRMTKEAEEKEEGQTLSEKEVKPQDAEFVSARGNDIPGTGAVTPQKRSWKKVIIAVIIAIAVVLVVAIIGLTVIMRGMIDRDELWDSDSNSNSEVTEMMEDDENAGEVSAGAAEVESQGKELPGGSYTVGEDIAPGKYYLTYTTKMSEEDYWSNDYFWITRSGSKGEEETLGGTKYDERFGSVSYEDAKAGKTFYANLKKGDKLQVDAEFGSWTY